MVRMSLHAAFDVSAQLIQICDPSPRILNLIQNGRFLREMQRFVTTAVVRIWIRNHGMDWFLDPQDFCRQDSMRPWVTRHVKKRARRCNRQPDAGFSVVDDSLPRWWSTAEICNRRRSRVAQPITLSRRQIQFWTVSLGLPSPSCILCGSVRFSSCIGCIYSVLAWSRRRICSKSTPNFL